MGEEAAAAAVAAAAVAAADVAVATRAVADLARRGVAAVPITTHWAPPPR